MRKFLVVALLATLSCSDDGYVVAPSEDATAPASLTPATATDPYAPGRVLARFRPGAAADRIAAAHGATLGREVTLGIRMLGVPAGQELATARALSRNPNVEFAEPDWIRSIPRPLSHLTTTSDVFFGYKWDLHNDGTTNNSNGDVLASTGKVDADVDWLEAFEQLGQFTGSAKLGIMDTGIFQGHEDLGTIAAQYDFHDDDPDATDDDGHGTHVAGIGSARADNGKGVAGIAYGSNVQLVIAKVCGPIHPPLFGQKYGCYSSSTAAGITWAVDNGANVLNLSLGGSNPSDTERAALQYARANDVLPVCAAGNSSTSSAHYPSGFPECVSVSATDWGDNLASYSNFGSTIELSAPGGDDEDSTNGSSYIASSCNAGSNSYCLIAGTSMASPQVAGLATLLHALGITDDDAKLTRMKSSADDLGAPGRDDLFGEGRINVYNAVNDLGGGPPPENTPPSASFTFDCTDLTCEFTDTSTDSDGSVVAWDWDFGDGNGSSAQNPSHTYAEGATYTVTLVVTDDDTATDTATDDVTVSESPPPPGGFTLSATGYKNRGRNTVDLAWSGATSTTVDVYRNGNVIASGTPNDGAHTDATGERGSATYVYHVCEAGTSTCSNEATVVF